MEEENIMGKCHVISAKRMGYEQMYDYYPFPVDKYSKEEAMAQFRSVQKYTEKNNGQWYPYTAYEYNGEIYFSIIYSGIDDESKFD